MNPETANQLLASGSAAGAGTMGAWAIANQATVPFIGMPLIVITMAATGALISFGVGAPVKDRRQMFKMALVNGILGAALTALVPAMMEWTWVTPALQPPFALVLALSLRWIVPLAIDLAPAAARGALKKFFGINVSTPTTPGEAP